MVLLDDAQTSHSSCAPVVKRGSEVCLTDRLTSEPPHDVSPTNMSHARDGLVGVPESQIVDCRPLPVPVILVGLANVGEGQTGL